MLLIAWVLLLAGLDTAAAVLGIAVALLGLTTWALVRPEHWHGLLIGYYLWQGSLTLFALGALAIRLR
jgi:hypothetical protein